MDTCNKLGEFTITGVERARKGEPKVSKGCRFPLQSILIFFAQGSLWLNTTSLQQ